MNRLIEALEWCANHKIVTMIVTSIWFIMTIILNALFRGQPLPVTGMILQSWMAFVNCFLVGGTCGVVWGYLFSR